VKPSLIGQPVPPVPSLIDLRTHRAAVAGHDGVAREYSDALNREVTYYDIPHQEWESELKREGLPEHVTRHLVTIAELHRGRSVRPAGGRPGAGDRAAGDERPGLCDAPRG
jgi:hypothetical protein